MEAQENRGPQRFWRIAAKLAWRDLRASPLRSAFVILIMALSIASVAGVRSASRVALRAIHADSKIWLGGDLAVDTWDTVDPAMVAALGDTKSTLVTWTMSMAASDNAPDAAPISIKAVDPSQYPFYGAPILDPPQMLAAALSTDTVVVSEQVLEKLQVRQGDLIRIGGRPFRISAVIRVEPERFMGVLGMGMRGIVSRQAFARSGIARSGNAMKHRILVKLPDLKALGEAHERLQELVPEGNVVDYREANRVEASRLESVVSFVSVTAFLTLLLGAMGVAIATRQHVEQRLASVAIMRVVGAQGHQLSKLFAIQFGMLFAAALTLGLPVAWLIRFSLLEAAGRQITLPPATRDDLTALFEIAGVAALALLPALLRPAMLIRRLRPAILLRTEAQDASGVPLLGLSLASLALLAAAVVASNSWASAAVLVVAVAAFVAIAYGAAEGCVRVLRAVALRTRIPLMRLGVSGMYRPGNRSRLMLVALSAGLMMMVSTFESSRAMVEAVADTLPYSKDSLFLAGFEDRHAPGMKTFLSGLPGVQEVVFTTRASVRLTSVNGTPVGRQRESGRKDANVGSWYLGNCMAESRAPTRGPAGLILSDDLASVLGARVGSRLEFQARDQKIAAEVLSIHRLTPAERFWYTFEIDCRSMERRAVFHQVEVRVRPSAMKDIRRAIEAQYPTLGLVTAQEVMDTLDAMARSGIFFARLVAWYAIAAGLAILMAIVAGSRLPRQREIAIFSAAGARRTTLLKLYTIEFAVLGFVAGLIGCLLSFGLTSVTLTIVFHRVYVIARPETLAIATIMSIAATVVAGWLPTYRLLTRTPMEILREE